MCLDMMPATLLCVFLHSAGTRSVQAATQTLLNVPYGLGEGEKLDVYLPKELSESTSARGHTGQEIVGWGEVKQKYKSSCGWEPLWGTEERVGGAFLGFVMITAYLLGHFSAFPLVLYIHGGYWQFLR